jgi:hypothetical protein
MQVNSQFHIASAVRQFKSPYNPLYRMPMGFWTVLNIRKWEKLLPLLRIKPSPSACRSLWYCWRSFTRFELVIGTENIRKFKKIEVWIKIVQCLIWNFSINCGPLGCDAVQSCRLLRLFQGNISLHVQSFSNHVQGHSSFTTFPQWQAQISNEFQVMHVTFQVLIVASMKVTTFGVVAPCSLVEVYRRFRRAICLHYQGGDTASIISAMSHRRDDGGSTHLWNVGLLPRDYTVLNPRSCHYQ